VSVYIWVCVRTHVCMCIHRQTLPISPLQSRYVLSRRVHASSFYVTLFLRREQTKICLRYANRWHRVFRQISLCVL
jgi:hypothetical protein